MSAAFPEGESAFFVSGPVGQLEAILLKNAQPSQGVAVICHPHPLKEGTMHNKVVHTLSRAFLKRGIDSIRFNYRGVGKSEGSYGDSVGETADLLAVLAWVDSLYPHSQIYLAGFSFGAYIAAMGATQHACHQLFSIAPAVAHQPYDQLPPCDARGRLCKASKTKWFLLSPFMLGLQARSKKQWLPWI